MLSEKCFFDHGVNTPWLIYTFIGLPRRPRAWATWRCLPVPAILHLKIIKLASGRRVV
jgi:hypothetical protein